MHSEQADVIGSPFKRHRASVPGIGNDIMGALAAGTTDDYSSSMLAAGHKDDSLYAASTPETKVDAKRDSDEEL